MSSSASGRALLNGQTPGTVLTTGFGEFALCRHKIDGEVCISLSMGDVTSGHPIVRLHSSCLFSETFGSIDCDCHIQLVDAMKQIASEGRGVLIYLFQEGRGHGLDAKIRATALERTCGVDTVEAFEQLGLQLDPRTYEVAVSALRQLQVSSSIRIITNNPRKQQALEDAGFCILETIRLRYPDLSEIRKSYLRVKRDKLNHQLDHLELD